MNAIGNKPAAVVIWPDTVALLDKFMNAHNEWLALAQASDPALVGLGPWDREMAANHVLYQWCQREIDLVRRCTAALKEGAE